MQYSNTSEHVGIRALTMLVAGADVRCDLKLVETGTLLIVTQTVPGLEGSMDWMVHQQFVKAEERATFLTTFEVYEGAHRTAMEFYATTNRCPDCGSKYCDCPIEGEVGDAMPQTPQGWERIEGHDGLRYDVDPTGDEKPRLIEIK